MLPVPAGYVARPPSDDDLGAIAGLPTANDVRLEQVHTIVDADFARDQWATDGFDLSRDAWLVETDGGAVVAYAAVIPDGPQRMKSWGVVHPGHLGRGIGSALLVGIEARAAQHLDEAAKGVLDHAVDAGDRAAASMLRARGFEHVRSFRHMQLDLDGPRDPGEAPDGIELRAVGERDLQAVHAIFVEAFRDEWGYRVIPFEEWAATEVRTPSADLGLWSLATDDGRPVAAITGVAWGDRGWIGELGVLTAARGRGIATALLRRAFATFAERGLARVMLNVDTENTTDAARLYERVGMRAVRGWELYERRFGA